MEQSAKERRLDSHNVLASLGFEQINGDAMRIAVGFTLEFHFDGSRPRIGLAIITARVIIGNGQSAFDFFRGIPTRPLFVLGLGRKEISEPEVRIGGYPQRGLGDCIK